MRSYLPAFVAFGLCTSYLLSYFPGIMGGDAAFQFVQVKTGHISNLHPPLMVYLWQVVDALGLDYGWFWSIPAISFWASVTLIVSLLFQTISHRLATLILFGCWPTQLFIFSALWKDSWFFAAMLWVVCACLMLWRQPERRSKSILLLFVIASIVAVGFRHNALLAIIPLAFWFADHWFERRSTRFSVVVTALFTGLLLVVSTMLNTVGVARTSNGPTIWLWDLAALSVATDTLLLPEETLGEAASGLDDVKREFSPETNTTLCRYIAHQGTTLRCYEPIPHQRGVMLSKETVDALPGIWLEEVLAHPDEYLQHRWRVMCRMLSLCKADYPWIITRPFPNEAYENNWYEGPPTQTLGIDIRLPSKAGLQLSLIWEWLRMHTVLMSGWLYILLLLGTMPGLVKQTCKAGADKPLTSLVLACACSAWLIILPLFIIAPNLQFRYIIWPVGVSLLTLMMLVKGKIDGNNRNPHLHAD